MFFPHASLGSFIFIPGESFCLPPPPTSVFKQIICPQRSPLFPQYPKTVPPDKRISLIGARIDLQACCLHISCEIVGFHPLPDCQSDPFSPLNSILCGRRLLWARCEPPLHSQCLGGPVSTFYVGNKWACLLWAHFLTRFLSS